MKTEPPQQQLRPQNRDLPASDQNRLCRIIPVASRKLLMEGEIEDIAAVPADMRKFEW